MWYEGMPDQGDLHSDADDEVVVVDHCDVCGARVVPAGGPYGDGICLNCHEDLERSALADRRREERARLARAKGGG